MKLKQINIIPYLIITVVMIGFSLLFSEPSEPLADDTIYIGHTKDDGSTVRYPVLASSIDTLGSCISFTPRDASHTVILCEQDTYYLADKPLESGETEKDKLSYQIDSLFAAKQKQNAPRGVEIR